YDRTVSLTSVKGFPAGARQLTVWTDVPDVLTALAACDTAYNKQTAVIVAQRGRLWAKGSQGQCILNVIVPPNSKQHPWSSCSSGNLGISEFNNINSYHYGGANVLFADGSVHFVKETVGYQTWWSLGTIAGGEVISADTY